MRPGWPFAETSTLCAKAAASPNRDRLGVPGPSGFQNLVRAGGIRSWCARRPWPPAGPGTCSRRWMWKQRRPRCTARRRHRCTAKDPWRCKHARLARILSQPLTAPDAGKGITLRSFATGEWTQRQSPQVRRQRHSERQSESLHEYISFSISVQQNLAAGRAAFADAGDVNRRALLQRAGILACAAAHAAAGIDARLLERLRVARPSPPPRASST